MTRVRKGWTPSNWASWKPFGIGEQRPNNYAEILRAIAENRDELGYAWRILNEGVCDGCALGTTGLKDWTLDGVHLCNIRLRLLRLNTMGALDVDSLRDVESLRKKSSGELRDLGRIPYPMVRRKSDAGFTRVSWDDALELIADRIRETPPNRTAYYLTSRGIPNEAYYCAQRAARAMGTNNIDNAARVCHSPSTVALKSMLGVAATTCSYSDWFAADVIVFIGSNVANNQPVATKYLHYAKKNGAQVLVVNPYREPGMERYWIPSVAESALFGTKLADRFYTVRSGGDAAFLDGVLKALIERDLCDEDFVRDHTEGFEALRADLAARSWVSLERASGLSRAEMEDLAVRLGAAQSGVLVWSMGITQHANGVDNVRAIINLGLARGFVGREGCGLMPIRGHSGVQGGAEMGAYASAFPGGKPVTEENAAALSDVLGFPVPASRGMNAPEMIEAAAREELDVLVSVGGNFLEVLPDPDFVESALAAIPLRVHYDLVMSSQMLVDVADTVVLLPAATRYETAGGVTETTTERRVIFSPEICGRRIGEARPEWEVFLDLARRVRPDHASGLSFASTADVRKEIARVVPVYDGIQRLEKRGDQFQYGGPHLCPGGRFPTESGRARFVVIPIREPDASPNRFIVTTRRGKQFNSMVHETTDTLTGLEREAVLINAQDARELSIGEGHRVRLTSVFGSFEGVARIAPLASGCLQVHWPEGNCLLDRSCRSADAGIPDYNARVRVERT
jgi:molybdopterin-dependent oxidoreductase alpha subunit